MSETETEAGASEETWASKIEARLAALEEHAGINDDDASTEDPDDTTTDQHTTEETQ